MQPSPHRRPWPLQDRPGYLLMRLTRLMTRYAEARIQPLGTGIAGFPVLNMLKDAGELTQKELTENLGVEQSSTAQLVSRLERDGFIQRRKDPQDGRSSLVRLTAKGSRTLPAINEIMATGNDLAVDGLSDQEIDQLLDLLKRMISNFEHSND